MTLQRANSIGWGLFELLTSSQMNTIDSQLPYAIDGARGGTYALNDATAYGPGTITLDSSAFSTEIPTLHIINNDEDNQSQAIQIDIPSGTPSGARKGISIDSDAIVRCIEYDGTSVTDAAAAGPYYALRLSCNTNLATAAGAGQHGILASGGAGFVGGRGVIGTGGNTYDETGTPGFGINGTGGGVNDAGSSPSLILGGSGGEFTGGVITAGTNGLATGGTGVVGTGGACSATSGLAGTGAIFTGGAGSASIPSGYGAIINAGDNGASGFVRDALQVYAGTTGSATPGDHGRGIFVKAPGLGDGIYVENEDGVGLRVKSTAGATATADIVQDASAGAGPTALITQTALNGNTGLISDAGSGGLASVDLTGDTAAVLLTANSGTAAPNVGFTGNGQPSGTPAKNTLYADNIIRAWGRIQSDADGGGATVSGTSFNIASASITGGDTFSILLDRDFLVSTNYIVLANVEIGSDPSGTKYFAMTAPVSVGVFHVKVFTDAGVAADLDNEFVYISVLVLGIGQF